MNRVTDMQRFRNSRKCNIVNHIEPLYICRGASRRSRSTNNVFVVAAATTTAAIRGPALCTFSGMMYILTDGLPILIILINIKLFRGTYLNILPFFIRFNPFHLKNLMNYKFSLNIGLLV